MKMNVIWIILSIVLIFFWGQASYGESILVIGTPELLIPLTYTHYLDGHPAIFFSEQQEKEALEKLLSYVSNIIFFNSNPLDPALQTLDPDYGIMVEDSKKLAIFEAKEDGIYEVYAKNAKCKMKNEKLEIKIDGRSLILDPGSPNLGKAVKWEWMGRVELKKGKHRVMTEGAPQELVIVPEKKVIETEAKVWNYLKKAKVPPAYFFSKELGSEIDSWEERSLKSSFYIPFPGKYSLRAKVGPQYVKALDYGLEEGMGKDLKEWSFIPRNVEYFTSVRRGILNLSIYFDGSPKEKEFLLLKRRIKSVDLAKYPIFEINYYLANPEVQRIEVILGIDLDNDGKVDTRISEELLSTSKKEFSSYSFNLYEKIWGSLNRDLPTNVSLDLVNVYLKISKREDLDCFTIPIKGWYESAFKNFGLYGFSEDKCVKSRDYGFNERLGLTKELKRKKMRVVLSRSFEGLDLEKYPFVNLIHQNGGPHSLLVNAVLYLDFGERESTRIKEGREFSRIKENDGKADRKVTQEGITPTNSSFDVLELVRTEYPNKKHYYLTKLDIEIVRNPEIATAKTARKDSSSQRAKQNLTERRKEKQEHESVFLQHLQIYNEKILPYEKAHPTLPTLKIDQKKLSLTKSGFWYTAQPTYLKEGYYTLDALFPGIETKLDFIAIEPENRSYQAIELSSKQEPEIVFQKINPTKYRVKVKNAKEPFWLIFSESFHKGWRAYVKKSKIKNQISKIKEGNFEEIVAEYPRLGVKEARHLQKFTPSDIKYLFRKADIKEHYLVNGYANAWYVPVSQFPPKADQPQAEARQSVDPSGKEMEIVLYFWPQSLFYLGLFISGLTFMGCVGYLVGTGVRKRKKRRVKSRWAGGKVSK